MEKTVCPKCNGAGKISDLPEGRCGYCHGTGYVAKSSSKPSNASGCFASSTKILTSRGWINIADVKAGAKVLSLDVNGKQSFAAVRSVSCHEGVETVFARMEARRNSFECTARHPVLTNRGWVRSERLRKGDILSGINSDGRLTDNVVVDVVETGKIDTVCNLIVDRNYNFAFHGGIASSFVMCRAPRTFMHSILDRIWRVDRMGSIESSANSSHA